MPRLVVLLLVLIMSSPASASLSQRPFGQMPDGRAVTLFTLTGPQGLVVEITDFGATLVSLRTPDRQGKACPA